MAYNEKSRIRKTGETVKVTIYLMNLAGMRLGISSSEN